MMLISLVAGAYLSVKTTTKASSVITTVGATSHRTGMLARPRDFLVLCDTAEGLLPAEGFLLEGASFALESAVRGYIRMRCNSNLVHFTSVLQLEVLCYDVIILLLLSFAQTVEDRNIEIWNSD